MKKNFIGSFSLAVFFSTMPVITHAGMSYECWSYKGSDLGKMVHVTADNREEAVKLAAAKFDKLSVKYDNVECK